MSNNTQMQTNSVATTKKSYEGWTPLREKVLIESMIEHRPFEKKKLQVAEANAKVKNDVNSVDIEVNPINSWTTFQEKLAKLIEDVKSKQNNDRNYGSGSNDSETHQENRILELIQLMDNATEASNKQEAERSAQLKKRRDQEAIVEASKRGKHRIGERTRNQLNFSVAEDSLTGSIEVDDTNPLLAINRGIKRSLENLENDRVHDRAAINGLKTSVEALQESMTHVLQKLQSFERTLHRSCSCPSPSPSSSSPSSTYNCTCTISDRRWCK